jgi:hypothetical protein
MTVIERDLNDGTFILNFREEFRGATKNGLINILHYFQANVDLVGIVDIQGFIRRRMLQGDAQSEDAWGNSAKPLIGGAYVIRQTPSEFPAFKHVPDLDC